MTTISAQPQTQRIRIDQHSAVGMVWFAGWWFTIGWLHLGFWKAVLGLLIWPYYVGVALSMPGVH